jgi:hypothetical protein
MSSKESPLQISDRLSDGEGPWAALWMIIPANVYELRPQFKSRVYVHIEMYKSRAPSLLDRWELAP